MSRDALLDGRHLVVHAALAPAAWLVHLSAMPALVPLACDTGASWPMGLTTLVCTAVAAAGVLQLHRTRQVVRSTTAAPEGGGTETLQRARLWSGSGLVVGWLFLALIVAEYLPTLVVDPCPP